MTTYFLDKDTRAIECDYCARIGVFTCDYPETGVKSWVRYTTPGTIRDMCPICAEKNREEGWFVNSDGIPKSVATFDVANCNY